MNQRFQQEEIKRVSELYAQNELYSSISSIGPQLESEDNFGLCAEECFTEVVELLSTVADRGKGILADIENIWFEKFNEYRRFDRQMPDEDLSKGVGIVLGFTILALDSSRHSFYRYTLAKRLTQVVAGHQFDGWTTTLGRIFSVPLPDGWFDGFIEEEEAQPKNGISKTEPPSRTIDEERLGSYFNAKFKGAGENYNYLEELVAGIRSLKTQKEVAMVAHMIFDCKTYFTNKPKTFSKWLREFFGIVGWECPKELARNKYNPDERIKRAFHYLK